MPIRIVDGRAEVDLCGDVAIQPFAPIDGVVYIAFRQGPPGEPGRSIDDPSFMDPVRLDRMQGVLIAADDPRSIEALIDIAEVALRDLRALRGGTPRAGGEG